MSRQDRTKAMIKKMLVENTGTHMLDSGGAYGRHWQRNQDHDFEAETAGALRFDIYNGQPEIDATLNLYHWLGDRLEYAPGLDRRFYRWAMRPSRENDHWLQNMEEFPVHLASHDHREVTGLYGDGQPFTVNTYNDADLLSQTIQYTYFEVDGTPYVLLQIHGGCDVRGGYTRPRVFRVTDEGSDIMDNAHAIIACAGNNPVEDGNEQLDAFPQTIVTECKHYWYTDDGSNWYAEGSTTGTQLEEYDASEDEADRGQSKLYVDDEHNGYCPKCGGILRLYSR